MDLKDFTLMKEDESSYTVGHPAGKSIRVAKRGLSQRAQEIVSKLKRTQTAADGLDVAPMDESDSGPQVEAIPQDQQAPAQGGPMTIEPVHGSAPAEMQSQQPVQGPPAPQPGVTPGLSNAPLQEELNTTQGAALAQQGAANQAARIYQQEAAAMQGTKTQNQVFAQYQAQDQKFMGDLVNEKIDPKRYMHNMDTGSKITAAIALMLGGAASKGGPNPAMQVMNNAIERDIEAQRNAQDVTKTLWGMNRMNMNSDLQANLQTQNQFMAIANAKIAAATAGAQGVQALAAAAPLKAQLEQQMNMNNFKMSLMDQIQQPGSMSAVDPAKLVPLFIQNPDQQNKAYAEIGAAQDTKRMSGAIMDSFEQAAKENTVMRTGAGMIRTPGSVLALHQAMQPTFKDLEGTVRQAAMENTFRNVTPAPGDSQHTIDTKRAALRDYLQSKASAPVAKGASNGVIDLSRYASTAPLAGGPQIKVVNGVRYARGPNGEAIRLQ